MTLLITGASGHIGRRAAELLAGKGEALRLMSRTPDKIPHFPGVQVVQGDFARPETLDAAFRGIDAALIISGSAPPGERAQHHLNAFQAAAHAHVGHVVYVSLQGTGPDSRFSYSRDHEISEHYLAEAGIPGFTVLRNAFYLDMLPGFLADGTLRDPSGTGRAAFISREDAARTAAAVLAQPPGGTHDVTGPEALSVQEAVQRLARLTGLPLRYEHAAPAGEPPAPDDWRATLFTGWFEAIAAGELSRVSTAVRRFTGTDPLTLEGYFSAFPDALAPLHMAGSAHPD